tara:strand:+ start:867 stop:1121 length:255 start_codon:yes stop_codon:yes gene_type:complete
LSSSWRRLTIIGDIWGSGAYMRGVRMLAADSWRLLYFALLGLELALGVEYQAEGEEMNTWSLAVQYAGGTGTGLPWDGEYGATK